MATENQAGLVVSKAPAYVPVVAGQVASAQIDLLALPAAVLQDAPAPALRRARQTPAAAAPGCPHPTFRPRCPRSRPPARCPPRARAINFDAVTCFVAGRVPVARRRHRARCANIARGRVYFRAAQGSSFYYIEMTQETGRFFGKLPRPRVEASPITYYLQATTTEFEESQTPEIEAIVVEKKEDCGDRKVAAYGPPGEVTVFSAATGAAIAPAGFAAGGAAIAAGTIALIAGGAAAAGIGVGVITNPPDPTPSPTPIPTPSDAHARRRRRRPSPTPSPTATPTPTPTPTVRDSVSRRCLPVAR